MTTDFGQICEMAYNMLAFRNGFEYWKSYLQVLNGNSLCTNINILSKFDNDRSTNHRDYDGSFCNFRDETAIICIFYQVFH